MVAEPTPSVIAQEPIEPALAALVDRIRQAGAEGRRLSLQGGGSKYFYGQAAQGDVLETRGWCGVISYEPSELVVTARAGTPLTELEAILAEQGQCLPFEPPHFDTTDGAGATVGGMVAAGLSGPGRASVGAVRDFVLGVQLVDGRGQVLRFGGQVMKNVAGYDVSRLLAGSLGTLGLIAEVSLKVLPRPPAQATLEVALDQQAALDALNRWGARPLPMSASSWHDGRLLLRLAGARAAVEAAQAVLGREAAACQVDPATAAAHWQALREQQHAALQPKPGHSLWRLSLPQTAPAMAWLGAMAEPLIEWHGAQRWLLASDAQADALRAQAQAQGGHATRFRALDAAAPLLPVFQPQPAVLQRIQTRLQQQFDPLQVFDRQRLGDPGQG